LNARCAAAVNGAIQRETISALGMGLTIRGQMVETRPQPSVGEAGAETREDTSGGIVEAIEKTMLPRALSVCISGHASIEAHGLDRGWLRGGSFLVRHRGWTVAL